MLDLKTHGDDPFNLQRFLEAQAPIYQHAHAELAAGSKRTHWMWFIFPQIRGLGSTPTAQHFAISGLDEAIAYLEHPILGTRLRDCTSLVNGLQGRTINSIFGSPDDLKFHSSLTLFAHADAHLQTPADGRLTVFADALVRYFHGVPDHNTLSRLT